VIRVALVLSILLGAVGAHAASMPLASGGRTSYTIVLDPDATVAEKHAADELASFLKQVTGAEFPVRTSVALPRGPVLLVGPGRIVSKLAPDLRLDNLQPDGIVLETRAGDLILAGDRPRGTLYAVYTFLEDVVGCRWWSAKASFIPHKPELMLPDLHVRYVPPLEYREPFWMDAFDGDFAVRNKYNGMAARIDEPRGGHITYGGYFVHTSFPLVPPEKYFKEHPEWYSEIGGKRVGGNGEYVQLCMTNQELMKFVTAEIIDYLGKHRDVKIVSVSQSDTDNHCQCAACKKLEEEEGSPSGPLLRFVNAIAAEVGKVYPDVAIDTLAYQYTRKPPKFARPLPNVIIRLCTIECDFSQPLTAPSNQKFADDIVGWSKICRRLYIWDYVTNFSNYIQPHPNYYVLGPNVRFFVANGVKGVFEQGDYTSLGGEFAELKAWVLAKVLWKPNLDDKALIDEFMRGYYGPATPFLSEYMKMTYDEAIKTKTYLNCFTQTSAPFLNLGLLSRAEKLFDQAEAAVKNDPALLLRVQVARLPLRYSWSQRWFVFQAQATKQKIPWPGPVDYMTNAQTFMQVAKAAGITMISEGRKLDAFEKRTTGLGRIAPPPPPGCEKLAIGDYIDLQDYEFGLAREGTWATLEHDDLASDRVAARMPGTHFEWAVQKLLTGVPFDPEAKYSVYVSIRCEKTGEAGLAFTSGVYDTVNKVGVGQISVQCAQVADGQYHAYKLATTKLSEGIYLWAAPPKNPDNVKAIWVDRFWLVQEH
jgi:hypothetical protein